MSKIVKIRNVGAGKCLNIHGSNVTSLSPHQNVTIWEDSGSNEQKWERADLQLQGLSYVGPIRSVINRAYGLNVYRTGNPYNCDLYLVSGNETDSDVTVEFLTSIVSTKIKLKNYDLYLTAASTANGANVYWAAESDSNLQKWYFETVVDDEDDDDTGSGSTTSKSLTMPQNLNQRYNGYKGTTNYNVIYNYGCCVCCVADVASYYAGKKYSVGDMFRAGEYTANNATAIYGNVPSANFVPVSSGSSESYYLSQIKAQIDQNKPVMVEMMGTYVKNGQTYTCTHWVVAYGYTNGCATTTDCLVLDPCNTDGTNIEGLETNLKQAIDAQKTYFTSNNIKVNSIVKTSAKN